LLFIPPSSFQTPIVPRTSHPHLQRPLRQHVEQEIAALAPTVIHHVIVLEGGKGVANFGSFSVTILVLPDAQLIELMNE
jgi:hypothetical protein